MGSFGLISFGAWQTMKIPKNKFKRFRLAGIAGVLAGIASALEVSVLARMRTYYNNPCN